MSGPSASRPVSTHPRPGWLLQLALGSPSLSPRDGGGVEGEGAKD